jgi:hypothetical protein
MHHPLIGSPNGSQLVQRTVLLLCSEMVIKERDPDHFFRPPAQPSPRPIQQFSRSYHTVPKDPRLVTKLHMRPDITTDSACTLYFSVKSCCLSMNR